MVIKTIEQNTKDLYLFFYFKLRHLKNFSYCGRSLRGTFWFLCHVLHTLDPSENTVVDLTWLEQRKKGYPRWQHFWSISVELRTGLERKEKTFLFFPLSQHSQADLNGLAWWHPLRKGHQKERYSCFPWVWLGFLHSLQLLSGRKSALLNIFSL